MGRIIRVDDLRDLKNYVVVLLDRSGSMKSIRQEVVDAFNEQVKTIRAKSGEMQTYFTLVTFSTVVDATLLWHQPVSELKELSLNDYRPDGKTALYDAIGSTIKQLESVPNALDMRTSFLLIIISDGRNNNSKEYTESDVAEMIEAAQGTDQWTFTYLGREEARKAVEALNIPDGNYQAIKFSGHGVAAAAQQMSGGLESFYSARSIGKMSVDNYYEEKPKNGPTGEGEAGSS